MFYIMRVLSFIDVSLEKKLSKLNHFILKKAKDLENLENLFPLISYK